MVTSFSFKKNMISNPSTDYKSYLPYESLTRQNFLGAKNYITMIYASLLDDSDLYQFVDSAGTACGEGDAYCGEHTV